MSIGQQVLQRIVAALSTERM